MNWKKIAAIVLLAICMLFVYINRNYLFVNPFEEVYLENISYTTKTADGGMLILDSSGSRLVKTDAAYVLEWEIEAEEKGFSEPKRVISNNKGHIFVQDIVKEEGGFRIRQERILEYSAEGEFLGIVADYTYENAVLAPQIGGIYPTENGMLYIYKEENGFTMYQQDGAEVGFYPFDMAQQYLASFAVNSDTKTIYYSTYNGEVFQYVDGKDDILLYSGADLEELSIPKEISMDSEQNLYIADIGLRDVLKIDKNGTLERITEDLDLYDKEIAYYLNADHGLVVCTEYSVKVLINGEYEYITSASRNEVQIFTCIGVWIAVCILGVAALTILVWLIRKTLQGRFTKIATGMILGVITIALLFMGILLPQFQERILNAVFSRAQLAAEITAEELPIEEFSRLDSASDFMSEDYIAVRNAVNNIFLTGNESIYDLYCTLYRIHNNMIVSTYCLQEDTGAIYPYDWAYEGSDEQIIMESGEGKTYQYQTSEGSYLFVLNPIMDSNGEAVGIIEVGTDLNSFQEENRQIIMELIINMIAITVVIILVVIEIMLFFQAKTSYETAVAKNGKQVLVPTDILRMIVFMIFFLTNMTTGFLPIYAMRFANSQNTFGIPAEVMAAIPISAEVVAGAVFSIFGNRVFNKLGERKTVIFSAVLFTAGFGLRIIPNIWILTIGNAVLGAGWGILLLIINTMIAMKPDKEKDNGFAAYSSAALNGVNCGVVFGGFLTKWFSYQWIFILSTLLSLLIYRIAKNYLIQENFDMGENSSEEQKSNVFAFLRQGKVLRFFAMIVIPVIACSYFINYMFPILASEYGLSETNIGYSYLLNGLCVMCFSNLLTNFFSRKVKKSFALVLASVLYAAAFFVVAWYQNIPALLVALILLGLSDSFGLPIQTGYYTDLEEVEHFGYDRAIGVYSLFENTAQSAGSFLFSYVLLIGVREGLYMVIGIILVLAFIFLISTWISSRKKLRGK